MKQAAGFLTFDDLKNRTEEAWPTSYSGNRGVASEQESAYEYDMAQAPLWDEVKDLQTQDLNCTAESDGTDKIKLQLDGIHHDIVLWKKAAKLFSTTRKIQLAKIIFFPNIVLSEESFPYIKYCFSTDTAVLKMSGCISHQVLKFISGAPKLPIIELPLPLEREYIASLHAFSPHSIRLHYGENPKQTPLENSQLELLNHPAVGKLLITYTENQNDNSLLQLSNALSKTSLSAIHMILHGVISDDSLKTTCFNNIFSNPSIISVTVDMDFSTIETVERSPSPNDTGVKQRRTSYSYGRHSNAMEIKLSSEDCKYLLHLSCTENITTTPPTTHLNTILHKNLATFLKRCTAVHAIYSVLLSSEPDKQTPSRYDLADHMYCALLYNNTFRYQIGFYGFSQYTLFTNAKEVELVKTASREFKNLWLSPYTLRLTSSNADGTHSIHLGDMPQPIIAHIMSYIHYKDIKFEAVKTKT